MRSKLSRRDLLLAAAASGLAAGLPPAFAEGGASGLKLSDPTPFDFNGLAMKAGDMAKKPYVAPPVRAADVLEKLAREPRTHFSIQERGRVHLVPVKDVLYLRAELKYVTVRTADREFLMEESLTRLEEEFHRTFVRIHRGCLVAIAHLEGFEKSGDASPEAHWLAVIEGLEERLPVSRRQAHVVREFGKSGA